jgi:GR25 family glycosyltransferase involved in LPS biosynthesis
MEYNKVWDFFDEIYCINLDHRTDRWEKAQKEFYRVGVLQKVKRFSAIQEKDGRLGVIKSNLAIIKIAKEKGLKNVLVFEDDVHFIQENNPIETLEKSISQIGNLDWWLFYLGANTHEPLQLITKSRPNLLILKNAFACHALCYKNKTFDFFIRKYEGLEKVEFTDILDVFMAQYFQRKNLCLVVNPIIATQSASFSDIEKQNVDYTFIEERFKNNTKNMKLN